MSDFKDNSFSADIITLRDSNSSNSNIDKLIRIFSINNNQKSESTTSSSNLKAVCSSNHESPLSFESSISFSKEKQKQQVAKQQQQQQQNLLPNQLIRKSDNLLTFSPVTPIVDSSEPISDCSENNQLPEEKAQTATYKSIMIIDVFDKFYSSSSLANPNQLCHQQHEQAPSQQQKSNLIIKNLNETISPTKVNMISNAINKHFNNFYLLNISNNIVDNEISSYDEKRSPDNIGNNVFVYKNSIRLGDLSEKMNALGMKNDQDQEKPDDDVKRCILLRNKHANKILDYVSDERKIFSYDLSQLANEDKNSMRKTAQSLTTVANNQKNNNSNLNKRKNLSEILNELENSLRSSISINQFTLDCLNDDLSETNSIIELNQNDEDDIFNTINSSDSIKNNMYLINSHLSCSFSDTTSNSTASSSKSSCSSKSACSSQSESSLSANSSRCSSRCSSGSNICNEKANQDIFFLKQDNVAKSNQHSCRSTPTFLLINDLEKSTTGVDPSAEFARADDVISVNMKSNAQNINHDMYHLNHNKSSDDEFTYSELNCLSNYEDDMPRLLKIEKLTEEEEEAEEECVEGEEEENVDEENEQETEKEREQREKSLFEMLNLNVHRLPGELLGMNLRVEENGSVIVVNIIQNSAADRSSDSNGNRCSIRAKDEITEINGVSLSNMSNEEILSVVQELPLFVSLTIKRRSTSSSPIPPMLTPNDLSGKSNSKQKDSNSKLTILSPNSSNLNEKIPPGYTLHNIYLSSMESKCIMPCDLKECNEVEGLYKIQRNTLQIGEEDHLKKGDILYTINDTKLEYKNKFDLISKLSSLDGIAEVCVLRKQNPTSCYTMMAHNVDDNCNINIPYHNGIFAQNSIKLTMRKYDKPSCKSNSDLDFQHLPESAYQHGNQIKTPTPLSPSQTIMEESEKQSNRECEKPKIDHELEVEKNLHPEANPEFNQNENQDVNDENLKNENMEFMSCLNGQVLTSMHSDNWLLLYDRKTSHHQLNNMNSVVTATTTTRTTHNSLSLNEHTDFIKSQEYTLSQFSQRDSKHNEHNDEEDDDLETLDFNNFSPTHHSKTTPTITTATGFMPTQTSLQDKQEVEDKIPCSFNMEDATMRSLTNSSCHSERSCVHLNCAFCGDEDENEHQEHMKDVLEQMEKEKPNEEQIKQLVQLCDVDEDNTSDILNQVDHSADIHEPCINEHQEENDEILAKPSAIRVAPDVASSSNSSISNKFVSTFQFQFNKEQNKRLKTQITFIKCEPDEQNVLSMNQTNQKDAENVDQEMKIQTIDDENEDEQKEVANYEVLKEHIEQEDLQEQIQENDSYLSDTFTTFNHANKTLNNLHSNDYYYNWNKLNLNTSNDLTCSLFNTTNNEMENSMIQTEERNREVHKLLNELLSEIECEQSRVGKNKQERSIDKENEQSEMNSSDVIGSVLNEILKQVENELDLKSESNKHDMLEATTNTKSFADLKKMMHQELVNVMKSAKSPTSTTKTSNERNLVEESKVSRTPMSTLFKNKKTHHDESMISLDNTNNFDLNSSIQHNLHCATVTTTVSPLAESTVSLFKFPSINNFNTLTKCLESVIELKKQQQQHREEADQERIMFQTSQIDQDDLNKNETATLSWVPKPPPPPPPPLPANGESIFKTLNKKSLSKSNETLSMSHEDNELRNYNTTTKNSKTINHEHKREFLKELQEKQQLIASVDFSSKFKLNTRFRNRKESSKTNLTERFNTLIPAARPYNTLKVANNSVDSNEHKQHFSSKTLTLSFAKNRPPTSKYSKTQVRFSTLPNSNQNLTDSANRVEQASCVGQRVEVKIETKAESNGDGVNLTDQPKPQTVLKSEDHSNEESTSIDYVESAFDKQIKQRPIFSAQIKFQHPARLPLPNNNRGSANSNDSSQENKKHASLSSTNESMTVKDKIRLFTSASTSNTNNANKEASVTQNINSSYNDLASMKPISIRKAKRLADSLPSIYPFQIASSFVSSSTSDSTSGSTAHLNCAPSVLSTTTASFVNKFNGNTNLRDFSARCLSTQTLSTNCNTHNSSSSTTTFLNLKAESCNQLNNQRAVNKKNEDQVEMGTIIYSNYANNKTANKDDSNDEKDKVKTFKSIKEKIAFFSSKANKEKEVMPISSSVQNASQRHINTPNKLANRIEIVELNNNQVKSNSYEYDSLRYAYKLNQLTTFSTRSECDTSSLSKPAKISSIKMLTNNTSVKSILFDSNENKISELIANMETKIKQL